ncbi:tryptophan halogenase family protein [Duganella callida]|uniref:Tryptophan 7-halogenase n=1 Tax=Duganella callida TaxID=2561932 RepID=A0A4Y9SQL2_9BURK|nr:tryptophan halogenase family protein [Duganella callida]TFW28828.1 tryptophan 7-halogenase [Duganella callida]
MENIKQVVIVGGGTAGWMTASALARVLEGKIQITLIESDDIGSVGVGESTIPMIKLFNAVLGIDEDEFMRATHATFKLGIEFRDWGRVGDNYMHGFGIFGQDLATLPFYQYWLRLHLAGKAPDLENYSINRMAAKAGKFMRADRSHGNSPLGDIVHAFHLDAGLYARYLRQYAEARGVSRIEGKVVDALTRASDGHVDAVRMENGDLVSGDLFIDCSGFRALLIEQALHTGFEDWSHWLPCDRAWAVPCELSGELQPYTRATARPAGWQWRIGLQHRTGNGHVYAARFMSDDEAAAILMANLDGRPLAEPRLLRFTAGKRKQVWNKNVVAVGLSSGFLEPLESTSIHLIQSTIARLITFFPDRGFSEADIAEFNRQCDFEVERIRDFLILHYHATERDDTPFWNHVRTMDIPDTLRAKMDLWRSRGRIVRNDNELFAEVGWLQVLHGQRVPAAGHHPLADLMEEREVADYLGDIASVINACVEQMPTHAAYIEARCASR